VNVDVEESGAHDSIFAIQRLVAGKILVDGQHDPFFSVDEHIGGEVQIPRGIEYPSIF